MQFGLTDKFTRSALAKTERAARAGALRVSVMSIWEVGMLESKGRLELKINCAEWVRQALATPGLALVTLSPEIAIESSRLPGQFHGDPADRLLVATARIVGLSLMTKDDRLLEYGRRGFVKVIAA
jgi:PIN domain nuclease of toxin-antitoxin system